MSIIAYQHDSVALNLILAMESVLFASYQITPDISMVMTMALMAATITMAVTTGQQHYDNNGDEDNRASSEK